MILIHVAKVFQGISKPRASGDDPPGTRLRNRADLVNPARAEMIPRTVVPERASNGKPRVSGDDPSNAPVGSAP